MCMGHDHASSAIKSRGHRSRSKVKLVPDMTYNVFGGTLNLAQSQLYRCTVNQLRLGGAGRYHVLSNKRVATKAAGKCALHKQLRLHDTVTAVLHRHKINDSVTV